MTRSSSFSTYVASQSEAAAAVVMTRSNTLSPRSNTLPALYPAPAPVDTTPAPAPAPARLPFLARGSGSPPLTPVASNPLHTELALTQPHNEIALAHSRDELAVDVAHNELALGQFNIIDHCPARLSVPRCLSPLEAVEGEDMLSPYADPRTAVVGGDGGAAVWEAVTREHAAILSNKTAMPRGQVEPRKCCSCSPRHRHAF